MLSKRAWDFLRAYAWTDNRDLATYVQLTSADKAGLFKVGATDKKWLAGRQSECEDLLSATALHVLYQLRGQPQSMLDRHLTARDWAFCGLMMGEIEAVLYVLRRCQTASGSFAAELCQFVAPYISSAAWNDAEIEQLAGHLMEHHNVAVLVLQAGSKLHTAIALRFVDKDWSYRLDTWLVAAWPAANAAILVRTMELGRQSCYAVLMRWRSYRLLAIELIEAGRYHEQFRAVTQSYRGTLPRHALTAIGHIGLKMADHVTENELMIAAYVLALDGYLAANNSADAGLRRFLAIVGELPYELLCRIIWNGAGSTQFRQSLPQDIWRRVL